MSKPHKNVPVEPAVGVHHDDEEVVHVPKGQSKLRFLVTLGLMLFVLVIFTVGDQLMGTFGRGPSNDGDYMTWVHPKDGLQRLSYPDFVTARRAIDNFFNAQGQRASRDQTEDDRISYLLITDRMARDAGVEVPRSELARILREGQPGLVQPFFTKENYLAALSSRGVSPKEFEDTLSWLMRVTRYEGLTAFALGTPDPQVIETSWEEQHQQYAFDVVGGTQRAEFLAAAELESPDDASLETWYAALSDSEKSQLFGEHYTPERISAGLISCTGSEQPAALLERFPAPESSDPALAGRSYYDFYQSVRYLRETPLEPVEPVDETSDVQAQLYLPYEEVAEAAMAEARVLTALRDLLTDVRGRRSAGEVVDLAALAAELGLAYESDGVARSQAEWTELVGPQLAAAMRNPGPGNLLRTPVVGAKQQWLAEVLDRQPSAPPTFAQIPAEVRKVWSERRAGELALAKLEGVYAGLVSAAAVEVEAGAAPPANVDASDESFAAALTDAGLAAQHIDWFDPSRDNLEKTEDPARRYLLNNYIAGFGGPLYSLKAGQVAEPAPSGDGAEVWMVRSQGARDPEKIDMRPAEYDQLLQSATFTGASEVYRQLSDVAKRYTVTYPGREAQDAQEGGS